MYLFLGVVNLITPNIVKPGACIIDVGITRIPTEDGRTTIVGDVDFQGIIMCIFNIGFNGTQSSINVEEFDSWLNRPRSLVNLVGLVKPLFLFPGVSQIAGYITPVPGGVGPMTVAMLMSNTFKAAKGLA